MSYPTTLCERTTEMLTGMRLYGAIGAAVVVALFLAWAMRVNHLRGQYKAALTACEANHKQFIADVAAKTAEAQRLDAEHVQQVHIADEQARSENDAQIRQRIANAVAAVRVRNASTQNRGSGSGAAPVSRPTETASGPDGANTAPVIPSTADLEICAENTEKAVGWQSWWQSVEAIPR